VRTETTSRRNFIKLAGAASCATTLPIGVRSSYETPTPGFPQSIEGPANYVLRIAVTPVEIAPKHIVSAVTYNGQFPGPLLRFKKGRAVNVEIHNETDTPEQLHWHGQMVAVDVDGAAEEGTPFHSSTRVLLSLVPALRLSGGLVRYFLSVTIKSI
jgi:FtsP/CotA-like multicopper oxidase with cupredoxin domain